MKWNAKNCQTEKQTIAFCPVMMNKKIEIKPTHLSGSENEIGIFFNGVYIGEVSISKINHFNEEELEIRARDPIVIEQLLSCNFTDIPDTLKKIKFQLKSDLSGLVPGFEPFSIIIERNTGEQCCEINFFTTIKMEEWRRLWTISEYVEEFRHLVETMNNPNIQVSRLKDMFPYTIYLQFILPLSQTKFRTQITQHLEEVYDLHEKVERNLTARLRRESVVMYFDFPGEVRVSCEQYLLYFIQFLGDLGVTASAELTHELGRVLFSVTPENKNEALDKIRLALEIFLRLPSGIINDSSLSSGIEIQMLIANIQHLKGQLSLAAAVIQAKDATIEAMRITIEQQRLLSSGDIVIQSLKAINEPVPTEDKEELLDGLIALTKYKGKGFEIDLPDVFRRLKKLFTKDKKEDI